MSASPKPKYTLEQYLEMDARSEERLEFWNGEVFSMSGGSLRHDDIIVNVVGTLREKLAGGECRVSGTEARIDVPDSPAPYHYADASVVCGKREIKTLGKQEMLVNPTLIVEVMSPTSEAFDRGDKFTYYKSVPSFREYVLIAQHRPHVTHYVKLETGEWKYEEINDLEGTAQLASVGCTLPLREVYKGVEFDRTLKAKRPAKLRKMPGSARAIHPKPTVDGNE